MKHLTLSNQSQFSYQKAANFFACVYWINCQNKNYPVLIVMAKILSTFFLMQHALKKNPKHTIRNTALATHCVGDLLIELPVENATIIAIPVFFVGHLCSVTHLLNNIVHPRDIGLKKQMALMAFAITSGFITNEIYSNTTGVMSCAVPVYALALLTLFTLSAIQKESAKKMSAMALLYIISDVLIAANQLIQKIPYVNYVTWPLYFFSQHAMTNHVNRAESRNHCAIS